MYPNAYNKAYLKLSIPLLRVLCVLGVIIAVRLSYSMFATMSFGVLVTIIVCLVICYGYLFARRSYLKKHEGFDLFEELKKPYEPWVEIEKES